MPESAGRHGPIDGWSASPDLSGIRMRLLPAAARIALRLATADQAAHPEIAGFRLDQPINRMSATGLSFAARLGPDEWLLVSEGIDAAPLITEIESALSGTRHSIVDISHRHAALEISGPFAADVLNSGCPLDLDVRCFPAGTATRTLFAKAEIVLVRTDDTPTYRLECWRSFAPYVAALLEDAAAEFAVPPSARHASS